MTASLTALLVAGVIGAAPPAPPATQPASGARTQPRSIEEVIDELAETPQERRRLRQQQAQALYLQAEQALRMGSYARALELSRTAAKLDPSLEAAAALARRLQHHENSDRARTDRRAGRVALHAALVRGHRAFDADEADAAIAWFQAVIKGANRLPRGTFATTCVDHAALALAAAARRKARPGRSVTLPALPASPVSGAGAPSTGPPSITVEPGDDGTSPPAVAGGDGPLRFPAWFVRLKQQLARRVTTRFKGASIQDVVTYLRKATGANVVLDKQNLIAMGYDLRPVDLKVDDLQAETVLWLATTLSGCVFVYQHEVVLVTSADRARRLDRPRDLPAADLHFETPRAGPRPAADPAQLAGIQRQVDSLARPEDFILLCSRLAAAGSNP